MATKRLFLIFLIFFSFDAFSQTREAVYVRIQETLVAGIGIQQSYINVSYPDKSSRYIELNILGRDGVEAEENGRIILSEISALLNDGYEIESSSVGGDSIMTTTVMIFLRNKN